MSIISTLAPTLNPSSLVPKKNVSMESLIKIGKIETRIVERKMRLLPIKYQNLKNVFCEENIILLF